MGLTPKQYFDAGQVRNAQQALAERLRERPDDLPARSFLFELLCFSGDWERAEKQLHVLADSNEKTKLGAMLYFSALHAEKQRQNLFDEEAFPKTHARSQLSGKLNGNAFSDIRDADPEIGARLEVFAAGAYMWLPFELVESIRIEPPQRLRDTLWAPAWIATGPKFEGQDMGEVLLPVIYPYSYKHEDQSVWLGRQTSWGADEKGVEYPRGQKMLIVDGEEIPFLEVRTIEFDSAEGA